MAARAEPRPGDAGRAGLMGTSEANAVCLGVIGAPHGVRGDVRVRCHTVRPEDIAAYGPLRDETGHVWRLRVKERRKEVVVVHLDGIDDRDQAAALNGRRLFVSRDVLPATDDDTFYHADLVGLAVLDASGGSVGTVHALHDFGAGDILEYKTADGRLEMVVRLKAILFELLGRCHNIIAGESGGCGLFRSAPALFWLELRPSRRGCHLSDDSLRQAFGNAVHVP